MDPFPETVNRLLHTNKHLVGLFIIDSYRDGIIDEAYLVNYASNASKEVVVIINRYLEDLVDIAIERSTILSMLNLVDRIVEDEHIAIRYYLQVVKSEDSNIIRETISRYIDNYSDDYYGSDTDGDLIIEVEFIEEASKYSEDQLDRVSRVLTGIKDDILSWYIYWTEYPSWKILHSLVKYADIGTTESQLLDWLDERDDSNKVRKDKISVFGYITKGDV